MAQSWCSGACHFSVGVQSGNSLYLGTSEGKPYEDNQSGWEDLFNDVTGSQCPYDVSQQGEQAYFGGVFTRFREDAYQRIKTYPKAGGAPGGPGTPGTRAGGGMGTLMLTEGQAYQVWMVNAYGVGAAFAKAAYATSPFGAMPGGVRYVAAWLHKWREEKGTLPRRITLMFRAIGVYNPTTTGDTLYDYNIAGAAVPD